MSEYSLLDPKTDFIFKLIFGNEKHPEILISFLNAVIKPVNKIVSVKIDNTELEKKHLEDKFSRLDVKATTSNKEIVNIEIQLKDEKNMIKNYEMREASLHDRVSALEGAEEKGYNKAKKEDEELIQKAKLEKEKAMKERERAQKEKERALEREEKERKEKEKAQKEKELMIRNMLKSGLSIEDISKFTGVSEIEIKEIIEKDK